MEEAPTPSMARCLRGIIVDSVSHPNDSTALFFVVAFEFDSSSPILSFSDCRGILGNMRCFATTMRVVFKFKLLFDLYLGHFCEKSKR